MIRAKGGNFNAMSRDGWFQCSQCGFLHPAEVLFNIEEDLYVQIQCEHCKKMTPHLWVGDNPEDVYFYGDITLDSRYYKYNTK